MYYIFNSSEGIVYYIDETTGALEVSHTLSLSSKDYPGRPGCVRCLRWTPDSCAIALAWEGGGLAIWSTFGALLLCSLKWDYGLRVDLTRDNPLHIHTMVNEVGYHFSDNNVIPEFGCLSYFFFLRNGQQKVTNYGC